MKSSYLMADLNKVLQEIHEKVAEHILQRVSATKPIYKLVEGDDGIACEVPTGEVESAATRDDIIMALALLKQNAIKAELKEKSTMGQLREKLQKRDRTRSLPTAEKDD